MRYALITSVFLICSSLGLVAQVPGTAQLPVAAMVAGTVRDSAGGVVTDVRVTLLGQDKSERLSAVDSLGAFSFSELPSGNYVVKINAVGMELFASSEIALLAGERRELPILVTRIPTKVTSIQVSATLEDVAQAQVKQQEQQRMLGFIPNYYTSYIWAAVPMTPKLKVELALRSTLDPFTFVVASGVAAAQQAHNAFPGYGQGLGGYGKRYGAAYADAVTGKILSSAVLPMVLHQDPRYFYRGSGTVRSRTIYALTSTIISRGDNGRRQTNYSRLLGSFAAAGLSNIYRDSQDRQVGRTIRNGLIILGGNAATNLMREFLSRKLTRNVPAFANGKP